MKKLYGLIGALALLVGLFGIVHSANTCTNTDFECYVSGPSQSPTTVFRVDSVGNISTNGTLSVTGTSTFTGVATFTAGPVFTGNPTFGSTTVALSTAPTSGNSNGTKVTAFLGGPANVAAEGSVLIATAPISNQVSVAVSTGTNNYNVVGIAVSATTSTGTVVSMYTSGFVLALTTGAVSAGDLLVTTQTVTGAGYLATNNAATVNTAVAVAVGTQAAAANGLLKVKLIR